DADGLLGQPRAVAAAQGPRPETDNRDLETFPLDRLHALLLALGIVGKASKEQCPPAGLATLASRDHRIRHATFEIVIDEAAAFVACRDPGALHLTHLAHLLVLEFCAQAAE